MGARRTTATPMKRHTILFLAANPSGTAHVALDEEARAIQGALERSRYRKRFEFVTRWAVESVDLLYELHHLKPSIVHFGGHGVGGAAGAPPSGDGPHRDVLDRPDSHDGEQRQGLLFQGPDSGSRFVSLAALKEAFHAAGSSVKLLVLNACHSGAPADELPDVDCIVGMAGSIADDAAKSFAISFYASLGERASVTAAYESGRAAINLAGLADHDRPQLHVRAGVDPDQIVFAGDTVRPDGELGRHVQRRRTLRIMHLAARVVTVAALVGLAVASYLSSKQRIDPPSFEATLLAHGPQGITDLACVRGTVLVTLGNEHREATLWQGRAHLTIDPRFEGLPVPAIIACDGFFANTTIIAPRHEQPMEVVMTRLPPPPGPREPRPKPEQAQPKPEPTQTQAPRPGPGEKRPPPRAAQATPRETQARSRATQPGPKETQPRPTCAWSRSLGIIDHELSGCRRLTALSENRAAYEAVQQYRLGHPCDDDKIFECP